MIDVKQLEKKGDETTPYFQEYKKSLVDRGMSESLLDQLLELNQVRKNLITQSEKAKAEQNKVSGEIAILKRNKQDASALLTQMQELSRQVKEMDVKAQEAEARVFEFASALPNKCHSSVPAGKSAADNKIVHVVGEPTRFSFKAKEHWELGESLGVIDFERAGKVAGARFAFVKGLGARLERGLMQFMMDLHSQKHGYTEVIPPFLANSKSFFGVGQFPKFKQEVFHVSETDYYLIPTAEVPVTNIFRDEILKEEELPLRFTAFSPCFRSEAGSHGRDTKGLIRQHQFNKVELMTFVHPDRSYEEHERLTTNAEEVLKQLELPYRRMLLCSGDISFGAAKCFDLEVWLPGPGEYREISSCSNFEDFQARRANIRFRPSGEGQKPQYVHTLNGSGLAVGRTLIAILENYQQEDGSVRIPKVLQPYMGGATVISASH